MELSLKNHEPRGAECGCRSCDRVFASERAFDAHRIGEHSEGRKCAENLSPVGLEMDSRGRWRRAESSIQIAVCHDHEDPVQPVNDDHEIDHGIDHGIDRKERLRAAIRAYTNEAGASWERSSRNEQKKRNDEGRSP